MDTIRQGENFDARVTSRYTVVLAAAKRARQITDGANPLTHIDTDRAVSIAVKEMSEGKLNLRVQNDFLDGKYERLLKDQQKYRIMTALSKDDLREDLKENYDPVYTASTDDDSGDEIFAPYVDDVADATLEDKDEFDMAGMEE